ncbi:MAG TPA: PAS domain S-box protein, partial [Bacteroidales bacterium]
GDKGTIWQIRHTPIFNANDKITGYSELSVDITKKEKRKAELKEAEKQLRESEQRFREIFENSHENLYLLEVTDDMQFRNLDFNPAFEKNTGYKRSEIIGEIHGKTLNKETSQKINEYYCRCVKEKTPIIDKEIELDLPIGKRTYMSSIVPIADQTGKIYRILAITRDITEQKQNTQKIELLGFALDNTSDAIFIKEEQDNHYLYVNHQACQFLGYSKEELCNMSVYEFDPSVTDKTVDKILSDVHTKGFSSFETGHKRKDGSIFPVEVTIVFLEFSGKRYIMSHVRDITEQKQYQQNLEMLTHALNNTSEAVYIVEMGKPNFLYTNDQASKALGYSRQELRKKTLFDIDSSFTEEHMRKSDTILTQKRFIEFETSHRRKDGTTFPVECTVALYQYNNINYLVSLARDITERKQFEKELRESEYKLGEAARIARVGYWDRDLIAQTITLSKEACQIFGLPVDFHASNLNEWHPQWLKLIHPTDQQRAAKAAADALSDGQSYNIEYRVLLSDGTTRYVHSYAEVTKNEFGQPIRMFGIMHDITERRLAEEALRESEEMFSMVFKLSPASLAITRLKDNIFVDVNEVFLKDTGLTREKVVGYNQYELDLGIDINKFEPLRSQGDVKNFEYSFENRNGQLEYGLLSLAILVIGGQQCVLSQSVRITELKNKQNELIEAYRKLKESEQRYREMFDHSHDSIFLLEVLDGPHFRLLDVNPQYEKEVGINREKHLGHTMEENAIPEVAAIVNAKYKRCLDDGTIIEETVELEMPQGLRIYHSVLAPIRDDSGKIYRIMGITRDVTEELKAKQELETSRQRLLKAELIASIGHIEYDYKKEVNYWSDGAYEILNVPPVLRRPGHEGFRDLVHPEDRERVNNAFHYATTDFVKFDEVYRIIDFKGTEKVIHGTGQVQMDKNGNLGNFFGIIQDITLMYNLNAKLFAEEEKFRILAESSPVGIYLSIGEIPVYANKPFLSMVGTDSLSSLSKINLLDLIMPEDKNKVYLLAEKLSKEEIISPPYKLTLRKNSGSSLRYFDIYVTTFTINNAKYLQFIVVDITEDHENERIRQQLAASALYIEQKNKFATELESSLKSILAANSKLSLVEFKPVMDILKSYSRTDKDWEILNTQIENIHPEFIASLRKLCSSLSVNEMKHCVCIRLNLDTKEIARFFNVKPQSIQTSRMRLKKKLGLSNTTDLREFILNI